MKSNTSPTGNALTYPGTYDLKASLDNRQRIKTRAEYNGRISQEYFSDQGKGKKQRGRTGANLLIRADSVLCIRVPTYESGSLKIHPAFIGWTNFKASLRSLKT